MISHINSIAEFSSLCDCAQEFAQKRGLKVPQEIISNAISWATANPSSTDAPFLRFSTNRRTKADLSEFFRASIQPEDPEGGSQIIWIVIHFGSHKPTMQDSLGCDSKGITLRINFTKWLEGNGGSVTTTFKGLTHEEILQRQQIDRERKRLEDAEEMATILSGCRLAQSSADHPYLALKNIDPDTIFKDTGSRLGIYAPSSGSGYLAIPFFDKRGSMAGLHLVGTPLDGGKFFKRNVGSISGCFTRVGFPSASSQQPRLVGGKLLPAEAPEPPREIAFTEGYASAVAYLLLSGKPTVCCHGASNASAVLPAIKSLYSSLVTPIDAFDDDDAGDKASAAFTKTWVELGGSASDIKRVRYGRGKDPWDALNENLKERSLPASAPDIDQDQRPPLVAHMSSYSISSTVDQLDGVLEDSSTIPRIDESALPKIFLEHLNQHCSTASEKQRDAAIISLLSGVSAVAGHRYYLEVDDDKRSYGNLWTLTLGLSGCGKSHILNYGQVLMKRCLNTLGKYVDTLRESLADYLDNFSLLRRSIEVNPLAVGSPEMESYEKCRREKDIREARLAFLEKNRLVLTNVNDQSLEVYLTQAGGVTLISQECFAFIKSLDRKVGGDSKVYLLDKKEMSISSKALCDGSGKHSTYASLSFQFASTLSKMAECSSKGDVDSGFFPRITFTLIDEPPATRCRRSNYCAPAGRRRPNDSALADRCEDLFTAGIRLATKNNHLACIDSEKFIAYDGGNRAYLSLDGDERLCKYIDDEVLPYLSNIYQNTEWAPLFASRALERVKQYALLFEAISSETVLEDIHISQASINAAIAISRYEVRCSSVCLKSLMEQILRRTNTSSAEGEAAILAFVASRQKKTKGAPVPRKEITERSLIGRGGRCGIGALLDRLVEEGELIESRVKNENTGRYAKHYALP